MVSVDTYVWQELGRVYSTADSKQVSKQKKIINNQDLERNSMGPENNKRSHMEIEQLKKVIPNRRGGI